MELTTILLLLYSHTGLFLGGYQWAEWSHSKMNNRISSAAMWIFLWPLLVVLIAVFWSIGHIWRFLDKYLLLNFHFNILFHPEKYKMTEEKIDTVRKHYIEKIKPLTTKTGSEIWVRANRERYIIMMSFKLNGAELEVSEQLKNLGK